MDDLKLLQTKVETELNSFGTHVSSSGNCNSYVGPSDVALQNWAREKNIISNIRPAEFLETGRGAQTIKDIHMGDLVLEVPQDLIISSDTAIASDKGSVFESLEEIDNDTKALLWTIQERQNESSQFAPFFTSLPKTFSTGLSIGSEALKELVGTPLLDETMAAREHIRNQYESMFPLLTEVFPDSFSKEVYTWENFLWATELWYSYGIQILFPDGVLKTCLVPFASLLNHSLYPHVTAFSRIDSQSKTLKLKSLRGCTNGYQIYLSYGPLSNLRLLQDYGFAFEENPYDFVPLAFELPEDDLAEKKKVILDRFSIDLGDQMIRNCSNNNKTHLSPFLMGSLRILTMDDAELTTYNENPLYRMVNAKNEYLSLTSLQDTMEALAQEAPPSTSKMDIEGESMEERETEREVSMARRYREGYRKILQSVIDICQLLKEELVEN